MRILQRRRVPERSAARRNRAPPSAGPDGGGRRPGAWSTRRAGPPTAYPWGYPWKDGMEVDEAPGAAPTSGGEDAGRELAGRAGTCRRHRRPRGRPADLRAAHGQGSRVTHLLAPSEVELAAAMTADVTGVAVLVRRDVNALRYVLLTEHLSPGVVITATIFDHTVAPPARRRCPELRGHLSRRRRRTCHRRTLPRHPTLVSVRTSTAGLPAPVVFRTTGTGEPATSTGTCRRRCAASSSALGSGSGTRRPG